MGKWFPASLFVDCSNQKNKFMVDNDQALENTSKITIISE
jgi:hypothetical protein